MLTVWNDVIPNKSSRNCDYQVTTTGALADPTPEPCRNPQSPITTVVNVQLMLDTCGAICWIIVYRTDLLSICHAVGVLGLVLKVL